MAKLAAADVEGNRGLQLKSLFRGAAGRSLLAVIIAMAAVHLIYSLSMPLLALALEREGVSPAKIGISTMAQHAAVFVAAPLTPWIMARLSPARLLIIALAGSAAIFILLRLHYDYWVWLALRFIMGIFGSFLWIASEAWINALAERSLRGRVLALYGMAGGVGMAFGPLVLVATGSQGWPPFLAASAILAAGCLPLLTSRLLQPDFSAPDSAAGPAARLANPFRFILLLPTPFLVVLLFSAKEESIYSFFVLYAAGLGVGERSALTLLTAASLGGICLQYGFGWLADKVGRRGLLFACLSVSLLAVALTPVMTPQPLAPLFFFLYGGIWAGVFLLALKTVGDSFSTAELPGASAAFSFMWGCGSSLGPLATGWTMGLLPESGYVLALGAFILLFLWLPLLPERRRKS